jgi:hypothetical protein
MSVPSALRSPLRPRQLVAAHDDDLRLDWLRPGLDRLRRMLFDADQVRARRALLEVGIPRDRPETTVRLEA